MSYEEPPRCPCGHRAEVHREWFGPRPKECTAFADGKKCECRAYVRSAT
jgi:hypothetical protein